ncbi:HAD family hydrolase [Gracilibacillus caseinilyticus]|uniref:HAD family hydrolase n=1 Tax=Gracilibacillus caseinilyticus TaxID=2932256 RepID=A0ABY4ESH4_9BACI|nr:HAD family hydrolase [Gracilibacillus caseinilyticus]UOQ47379.1 HAD family hydrolase [Gracilibacillus caseinilyticus]
MKTIIFDVDDTLYDQSLSFHHTFRKIIASYYSYDELDQIYRRSREYSEILFDKSEAGEISIYEWQTGRIIKACQDFNIVITEAQAASFHQQYKREQAKIQLFPEMEQLLTYLKDSGKQMAILTNGDTEHQTMKIKQLGLEQWIPADHIFISGSYGVAKPKLEIFQVVEQALGCHPDDTVYIGDSFEKDIEGAKHVGWKAIWMNHRKRTVSNTVYEADQEIHHASELLAHFQVAR